uniref:DNA-directed DNA polymerase n=1 Tax=Panagrellus redivivus TaxID=6233 RepID=A0A7E4V479_PANRE
MRDVGGYSLYADLFVTEDEFNQMFDLTLYNAVRKKYHCEGAFPKLYDKVFELISLRSLIKVKKKKPTF